MNNMIPTRPTLEQLDRELTRRKHKKEYRRAMRATVWVLVVVAAVAVICANYFLSVLRIQGVSMAPTLREGQLVAAVKTSRFTSGDIIAFYYSNKVLLKRVIGKAGDWIDIDGDGNVSVNGEPLEEPYLAEKSLGECDIELPFQVPDGRYFVLGDHRDVSADSRSSAIGTVAEEQVIGRVFFRVWPFSSFGGVG